jgi:hypothetical protein
MKSREIPGGTGPAHVRAMLKSRREFLTSLRMDASGLLETMQK